MRQPLSAPEYLAQIEPAARLFFGGVESYMNRYRRIRWPSQATSSEELAQGMKDLEEWQAGEFSLAVICGSILQLADHVLEVYSTNTVIPPSCRAFAQADAARYCIGREVVGLPLGALVHAGRNQFAHWQDELTKGFRLFTQGVFDALLAAHYSDPHMDLVYDLGNRFYQGTPIRSSSLMLSTIRWSTYDHYLADMRDMLGVEESAT